MSNVASPKRFDGFGAKQPVAATPVDSSKVNGRHCASYGWTLPPRSEGARCFEEGVLDCWAFGDIEARPALEANRALY